METYRGWTIEYLGREDRDGMWSDHVEPNFYDGALSHRARQICFEKFRTREEAHKSGMEKARKWIDSQPSTSPLT